MKALTVFEHETNTGVIEVVDSRQVAEMIGKEHKNLLRDIAGYIETMTKSDKISQLKIEPSDFFIESTFENRGKQYPCYLLTKKGCDMVANKMTGEKGVLFTAAYVTAFEAMRKELGTKPTPAIPDDLTKAKLKEVELARYNALLALSEKYTGDYHDVLVAHATKELTGQFLLPLPEAGKLTLSATEVGERLGVSSQKVGSIANKFNLKTEEYGKWFVDKSRYSDKQVETFRYYENVLPVMKAILEG